MAIDQNIKKEREKESVGMAMKLEMRRHHEVDGDNVMAGGTCAQFHMKIIP